MSGFHAPAAPHCTICDKTVYKMEEIQAIGKYWHKDCFTCGTNTGEGCHKKLTLDSYTDHGGMPYCKTCFGKLYGPRGFSSNSASVHSYVGDAGVQPVNEHASTASDINTTQESVQADVTSGHVSSHVAAHETQPSHIVTHVPSGVHALGGTGAPKCKICTKSVFKMEEVNAIGHIWHKDCFTCGAGHTDGCHKKLTLDGYTDHEGTPYCKTCFGRLFGPRGYNNSAGTHSYVDDHGVGEGVAAVAISEHTSAPAPAAATAAADVHAAVAAHNTSHAPSKFGGAPKCAVCDKSVYKAEEVVAISKTWHKDCFTCGGTHTDGCKKHLTLDTYTPHEEQPYCRACFARNFGPRGYNNSAGTHSYVGDAGVPADTA